MKKLFIGLSLVFPFLGSKAQLSKNGTEVDLQLNSITTAVPFLLITPDSRSGAMGDIGVALSPDANSIHWNPAKLAFAQDFTERQGAIALSYSPWLSHIVDDINLAYLSGYYQMDENTTFAGALRYFSLGEITFTNAQNQFQGTFKPNEFSIDGAIARKLNRNFSMGMTARYIYSNLTAGYSNNGSEVKPGQAFSVDLAGFYTTDDISLGGMPSVLNVGMNISNIGNKISYTSSSTEKNFLPMNMRLGAALTLEFDENNQFTFGYNANKLLVPTRPKRDPQDRDIILAGKEDDVGVISGLFQSFSDAPGFEELDDNGNVQYNADGTLVIQSGSVFREEMREINHSIGAEYLYANTFAVRAGYFHEHYTKGNRRYFTLGAGLKYKVFQIDMAYLVAVNQQINPLANTIRFTLKFAFENEGKASN